MTDQSFKDLQKLARAVNGPNGPILIRIPCKECGGTIGLVREDPRHGAIAWVNAGPGGRARWQPFMVDRHAAGSFAIGHCPDCGREVELAGADLFQRVIECRRNGSRMVLPA